MKHNHINTHTHTHTSEKMEILTDRQRQIQSRKPLYRESISVFPITQSQTMRQAASGSGIVTNDNGERRKRGDK